MRNGQRDAAADLCVQKRRRGRCGDQIDAEVAADQLTHSASFVFDECWRLAHHAEKAEAAGSGHRRHELGAGDATHPGEHNRILAAKDFTNGRA